MSKKKIKATQVNRHRARFHPVNIPVELWPNFVDFLWGAITNVNPNTISPHCVNFIQQTVYQAIGSGSVKIENDKIKLKEWKTKDDLLDKMKDAVVEDKTDTDG